MIPQCEVTKDMYNQSVGIGDYVVYFVRGSTNVKVIYAQINQVILHIRGSFTTHELKVTSMAHNGPWRRKDNKYHIYNTTLTSRNFVKVSSNSIPQDIMESLIAFRIKNENRQ